MTEDTHNPEATPPDDAPETALVLPEQRGIIPLSGDIVTRSTAHLPDEQKFLVRWSFDFAKSSEWGWKEAAENLKTSTTVLYRIWTDKYRQPAKIAKKVDGVKTMIANPRAGERIPLDGVCGDIRRMKQLIEMRSTAITAVPFIENTTWRKIDHICTEVLVGQSIGLIYGESQIGKTTCLKERKRRNNHGQTSYVDCGGDGVQGLCTDIAHELHVGRSSFDKMFRGIVGALDGSKLLILDDVHVIFECYQKTSIARCLTMIRKIHDRSGCGLIISATDVFATKAAESEFKNTMKQFFRRGVLTLQLGTEPPWDDVLAFTRHYKLPDPKGDVEGTLRLLARHDGLGKITKYLGGAARSAAKKKQPFNWSHFEKYYDITTRMAAPVQAGKGEA